VSRENIPILKISSSSILEYSCIAKPIERINILMTDNSWAKGLTGTGNEDTIFHEGRRNGHFPPHNIAQLGSSLILTAGNIELRSASLTITGDPAGNVWICSLWTSLTEETSISALASRPIPRVLQKFLNQQAGGRCLAFLILLGHLCEKLAVAYEGLLEELDGIVGLGVS
jgi:hypothetical protein